MPQNDSCIGGGGISRCVSATDVRNDSDAPGDDVGEALDLLDEFTCLTAHTGLVAGGRLNINADDASTFDVEAGEGWIVDKSDPANPVCISVKWETFLGVVVDNIVLPSTGIAIDRLGQVVQSSEVFGPTDFREVIVLGRIAHPEFLVTITQNRPQPAHDDITAFFDFMRFIIGPANGLGNLFSANGANLMIDKTEGRAFFIGASFHITPETPDITQDVEQIASVFFRVFNNAAADGILTDTPDQTQVIDPGSFDDGSGILASVGGMGWTIQICYWVPGAPNGIVLISYGQQTFNTEAGALNALSDGTFLLALVEPPQLLRILRRAFIVVQVGTTDLAATATFVEDKKFRIQ